ncbi:MAG: penicillin-binding protein 2 [Okeania sp. SIO2G4]|uniref:penicillin-binding protein 2 n=1 Tax=unclassified Okeania TaxID=2634635 RepID=UPI0013BA30E6|nr:MULTISPECIES: penicillin-binding protein 2 [unclassified Okeania]NEP72133.1 penicillin-binding protein 2 [Okeania sp. SIO2G5]NEP92991.1 penicillin-binding protein 2 [Okeania sp. SIO2F5]NEQ91111.1 penicillin-binding protein 2 [Okeania sp. SIO2G4]
MTQDIGLYSKSPHLARSAGQQIVSKRSRLVQAFTMMLLITSLIGINAYRVVQLQLVQGKYNRERAENNRIRLVPVAASRGTIYDRKGKILAGNKLSRSVYLWPQEYSAAEWSELATELSSILDISASDIINKLEEVGYDSPLGVRIFSNLDPTTFIALAEKTGETRGLEVRTENIRYYPNGSLAAHLIGYTGEATKEELISNPKYPMGMIVGKMGIESSANSTLEGVWGNRLIEVDAKGNKIQELGAKNPTSGKSVKLTLDIDIQKAAEKALGNRRGVAVAINPKTGEILAMASRPTFDPSLFTGKMTTSEWQRLQGASKPFFNRALQGYPPGSTFKTVASVAALQSGKYSPNSRVRTYNAVTIGGITFNEHSGGYGLIGFRDALAYSSNTFFYQMAVNIGPEVISKWGRELGIGGSIDLKLLGIDGNHGQIPTPKEKEEIYGEPWHIADIVTMGIGQGLVLVTPLESSVMVSTIANGGYRVKPHLLASQTGTAATKSIKTGLKPSTINTVREGLIDVVRKGTGRSLNDGTIPLSGGKTGTVELPGQADNAMYIGFAPAYNPEIAVAIAVEEGGYGSVGATPIAKAIFDTYFANKGK